MGKLQGHADQVPDRVLRGLGEVVGQRRNGPSEHEPQYEARHLGKLGHSSRLRSSVLDEADDEERNGRTSADGAVTSADVRGAGTCCDIAPPDPSRQVEAAKRVTGPNHGFMS